jgi:hypothetical protein
MRFSPVMDRRSTITVSVNDRILSTRTLADMGANPSIDQTIPVPSGTRGALQIAVTGHFFEKGDICFDLDTNDFWMTVGRAGILTATTQARPHRPYVRDFFHDYGGSLTVVVPANASNDLTGRAIGLAYFLHQINRWRSTSVRIADRPDPGARNLVLGEFPSALEMRGPDLYANADGAATLEHQLEGLLVTDTVETASSEPPGAADTHAQTFEAMGFPSQTLTGTGELPFAVPLAFGRLGGMPADFALHLNVTHTPVVPEERAYVKVMVNGTLVRSFEFRPDGGEERYDVPVSPDLLRASNDVRIVPTYFYQHNACKGSYPRMTASLLGTSSFTWSSVERRSQSIGEFFNLVSGRVVVLLGARTDASYAFALLDALGTVNTSIRQIDVQDYSGGIPSGYDYAIVVAAPERLSGADLPLQSNDQGFTVRDDAAKDVALRAQYAQPFGVLEVDAHGSPALYATYWKDPSVTAGIGRIAPAELAEQSDDLFLFDAERATYSSVADRPHRTAVDPLRERLLWILILFAVLLLAVLAFTARRARKAS